jgi:cell division transport system permease protein
MSIAVGVMVGDMVKSVEDKVSIQIFLKDGAPTEGVQALQAFVSSDPLVRGVTYTTKEQALEDFREQMASSPEIIDQIETNPLPASLGVELVDAREVEVVVEKIKASELFLAVADRPDEPERSLQYGEGIVRKLFAFTRTMRIVAVVFIGMLASVSLIFINNTIRLAIYARRKEIGIMRLVGASNWFIRTPFLLEGVFQAMIGAALAIASIAATRALVLPRARETLSFLPIELSSSTMVQLSLILVAAGIVMGLIGSGLALRRYLKV